MARDNPAIVNWSQYLGLRAVSGLLQCFDPMQNLRFAASIGSLLYRSNRNRRLRATGNLARSFPDWSPEHVERVAERSFQHMIQIFMVDALVTHRLVTETTWPDYIELGNMQPVLETLRPDRSALLVTGHCGNWELLGHVLSLLGFKVAALARSLDNPLLNDYLMGIREARGLRIVTKFGATPVLHDILENGGTIGFIADQNAGDGGLFVPFFGRLASSYKSIGLLAMRYRCPIIAGSSRRLNGLRYQINCNDLIRPEEWENRRDPLYYITARINLALEDMIRAAPEQYLWLHRRWKSRPRHERLGREFPPRLRAQLESLPWLTSEDVERVIADSVNGVDGPVA